MGKNTGSKRTIRPHVIEAVGSHEVWNRRESKPTGGKRTLRGDLIERGGSSEAWYGEPPGIRTEPGLFRDACCDSRFSRPARLFSLDLLDVPRGVRLRRPRFRAAPADFGLNCLATASLNNPGYGPRLKISKSPILTAAWFCDGFSVFLAESRRFSVSTDSMGFQEFFPVCRFLAQI